MPDGSFNPHTVDVDAVRVLAERLKRTAGDVPGEFVFGTIADTGKVQHYPIPNGADAVERIVELVQKIGAVPHLNTYYAKALFKSGSIVGNKGRTWDNVELVFGGVCDFDKKNDPATRQERLPLPPSAEIETSPDNVQSGYWFDAPLSKDDARPLLWDLADATGADDCKTVEHLWRCPGTWNWPDEKKVAAGRDPAPFQTRWLKSPDGPGCSAAELRRKLPETHTAAAADDSTFGWDVRADPSKPAAKMTEEQIIRALSKDGDKSAACAAFIRRCLLANYTPDEIAEILVENTDCPVVGHYKGSEDAVRTDVKRLACKPDPTKSARGKAFEEAIKKLTEADESESGPAEPENAPGFDACPDDLDDAVDWMNERYTLARFGASVIGFDLRDRPLLPMPRETLQAELAPQRVLVPGKPGDPPIAKPLYPLWFNNSRRSYYRQTVFRPCADLAEPVNLPPDAFNLFTGWSVPRVSLPRGSASYYPRFREHLFENVANYDAPAFVWLWCWWAQLFQHPEKKPGTALVHRGRKGTGKTTVPQAFGRLMPDFVCSVSKPQDITGTFNMHLARALLVIVEEAFWAGSHEAEAVFKDLITATHFKAEPKGIDSQKMESYARFVVLGNEKWLVPATWDERRFFALKMGEKRRADAAYFKHIDEVEMAPGGDGLKALLDDLMETRAPSWVSLGKGLHTTELEQQIAHRMPLEDQWLRHCLAEGVFLSTDGASRDADLTSVTWPVDDRVFLTNQSLYACYLAFARNERHKNEIHFGRWLSDTEEGAGAVFGNSCRHGEAQAGRAMGRWISSRDRAADILRAQQREAAQLDRAGQKLPEGLDPAPWVGWAVGGGKLPGGTDG